MPDQLVCERPTDTSDQEVPDGMFQNRSVTYFEYMADVSTVSTRPRLGETHVANTASNLNKRLARDFRVGLPRYAMVIQKPIDFRLVAFLATHQIDFGVPEDPHRINRIHSMCFLETASISGKNYCSQVREVNIDFFVNSVLGLIALVSRDILANDDVRFSSGRQHASRLL
jgi:hypothetical protein